jgi:hypothetical protein
VIIAHLRMFFGLRPAIDKNWLQNLLESGYKKLIFLLTMQLSGAIMIAINCKIQQFATFAETFVCKNAPEPGICRAPSRSFRGAAGFCLLYFIARGKEPLPA